MLMDVSEATFFGANNFGEADTSCSREINIPVVPVKYCASLGESQDNIETSWTQILRQSYLESGNLPTGPHAQ